MTKRSPDKIATLREMAEVGSTTKAIAQAIDVSATCVVNWALQEGIKLLSHSQAMKKLHADPAFAAARKASRNGCKGVEIPHWVPEDLHDEFLKTAAALGEIDAARHIRRLKADMREGATA